MISDSIPASNDCQRGNGHTRPPRNHTTASTSSNFIPRNHMSTNMPRRVLTTVQSGNCYVCDGGCVLASECPTFLKMSVNERWSKIKSDAACFSCLKRGHLASKCYKKQRCSAKNCFKYHHSILHPNDMLNSSSSSQPSKVYVKQTSENDLQ